MFASDTQVNGIWYNLDSNSKTAEVTYRGSAYDELPPDEYSGSLTIPSSVEYNSVTYSVTSIGMGAFYKCLELTAIVIPNTVTAIGEKAFYGCVKLSLVTLLGTITGIYSNAFAYCDNLNAIYVPCGDLNRIQAMIEGGAKSKVKYMSLSYSVEGKVNDSKMGEVQVPVARDCDTVLNAIPHYGYHFVQWSDGIKTNPRPFELIQDTSFTAEFAINQYAITVSCDDQYGAVKGQNGSFDYLTELTYEAVPNYGFHFAKWSDGNTQNPRTITVQRDSTIQAVFNPNQYKIIDASDQTKGKIIGAGKFDYMTSLDLIALPDRGYRFVQWGDGATENPRSLVVTKDTTIVAIFDYILSGKCGKDTALAWTLDTTNMSLNINGKGDLSDRYTYGRFVQSVTIGNDVEMIGEMAFHNCYNLKKVILGASVRVLDAYSFFGCPIEKITCYSMRPPTVNNAFFDLPYSTKVYVLANCLNAYKQHDTWGLYDVQPLGTASAETSDLKATPAEYSVEVVWPAVENAATYELVIKDKNGIVVCTLVFNADGQLIQIVFNEPARHQAPQQQQSAGFTFTVTGLESGTSYDLTMTSKDDNGSTLDSNTISFTTTGEQALDQITNDTLPITNKIIKDNQILILRGEHAYTITGQELR